MTPLPRALVVPLQLLGLAAAGFALLGAASESWLPLEVGARWTHRVHEDRSFALGRGPLDRNLVQTEELSEVLSYDDNAQAFRIQRSRSGPLGGPPQPVPGAVSLYATPAGAIELRGSADPARPGAALERFDPPIVLIPADVEPGQHWKAGTLRRGSVRITLEGDATGYVDLTEEGAAHPHCLRVVLQGKVAGSLSLSEGSARVRDGRYERELFVRRGVGLVRDTATLELDLELPDGGEGSMHEITTRRLVSHEGS